MIPKLILAKTKDFKEISKIYCAEFSKAPYNEDWTDLIAFKRIKQYSKYCDIWKLILNKEIIGFFVMNTSRWCPKEVCFGEEQAIKSEYQNKGYGKYMLTELFKNYKTKGFKTYMGIVNVKGKALKLNNSLGVKNSRVNILIEKKLN